MRHARSKRWLGEKIEITLFVLGLHRSNGRRLILIVGLETGELLREIALQRF